MKIYLQVLTFFIKPKTWLFHVVVLLTTAKKWTKVKNVRAVRAKLLFLPTKYAKTLTFSLPSPLSLLKLPNRELTKRGRRRQRGLHFKIRSSSSYSYHYETISCRFALKMCSNCRGIKLVRSELEA